MDSLLTGLDIGHATQVGRADRRVPPRPYAQVDSDHGDAGRRVRTHQVAGCQFTPIRHHLDCSARVCSGEKAAIGEDITCGPIGVHDNA